MLSLCASLVDVSICEIDIGLYIGSLFCNCEVCTAWLIKSHANVDDSIKELMAMELADY